MAYHYQCGNCYCTLYLENADKGEPIYSVINGVLCGSCQAEEDTTWEDD